MTPIEARATFRCRCAPERSFPARPASAPAAALATKFGFTPERVLEEARKQAARGRTGNGKESAR